MSGARKPKPRRKRTAGNRRGRPFQRASDGKWVAVAYLPNGKRKPVYGSSAAEVEDKRRQVEREIEDASPITVGRTDTLEQYLMGPWLTVTLPQRVAAGRLAESTLDSYRDTVVHHIVPHLGKVRLVDLAPLHIRGWLLELKQKPSGRVRKKLRPGETELPPPPLLSSRTIAYAHAVLRRALGDALDDELIKRNVCTMVDPPVAEATEIVPPTKEETRRLLSAAAGDRLWAYWLLVLALGLRRGEGLGVRWDHIDFDAGTVRLEKSLQRLRGELDETTGRRRGRLVEKGLKTSASKATLALPATVVDALREHRKMQAAEQLQARVWADKGLVFASTVGTPLEPRNVGRAWHAVCDRAGVRRFRIHDLRHLAATVLFESGVDRKIVQATLRHTRESTTSTVYTHVVAEVQRRAADSMDTVIADLTKKTDETA